MAGLVVPIAALFCQLSHCISLSRVTFHGKRIQDVPTWLHSYILAWFVVLVVLLLVAPSTGVLGVASVVIAFYRLQDFLFASLDQALELTGTWDSYKGAWQAPVFVALINVGQLVLVFGIAFHGLLDARAFHPWVPHGQFGWLFVSWESLPVFGTGFLAVTNPARVLTMVESGIALLLLTITLARFLDKPSDTGGARPTGSEGPPPRGEARATTPRRPSSPT